MEPVLQRLAIIQRIRNQYLCVKLFYFLNIGAYVAGQSNCICMLDIIWSGYVLKTLKPEITCLQAITIYSALQMGKWWIVSWREMFISFQLLQGRDSGSSSNSVRPMGLYVWPQIEHAWLTLNRACILHRLMPAFLQRAETLLYHFWYPITSHLLDIFVGLLRCALCTLSFHIIS